MILLSCRWPPLKSMVFLGHNILGSSLLKIFRYNAKCKITLLAAQLYWKRCQNKTNVSEYFSVTQKCRATCINVTILTVAVAPGGDITTLARFAQNRFEMCTLESARIATLLLFRLIVKRSFPKEHDDIMLAWLAVNRFSIVHTASASLGIAHHIFQLTKAKNGNFGKYCGNNLCQKVMF